MGESFQTLRVGSIIDDTVAEGPGRRFALWVQGCSLRCPGCCNPHFFEAESARSPARSVAWLLERLQAARAAAPIEGVSLLGGEPFEQAPALAAFARGAHAIGLSVMGFSGYALEELRSEAAPKGSAELLAELDLLVDGRYQKDLSETSRRWAGSQNQRFHFLTARYAPGIEQIGPGEEAQTVEVRLSPDGLGLVSGWPEQLGLGRRLR